ncbi:hypothetical protein ABKN59_002018 [Abortiporus biennis]
MRWNDVKQAISRSGDCQTDTQDDQKRIGDLEYQLSRAESKLSRVQSDLLKLRRTNTSLEAELTTIRNRCECLETEKEDFNKNCCLPLDPSQKSLLSVDFELSQISATSSLAEGLQHSFREDALGCSKCQELESQLSEVRCKSESYLAELKELKETNDCMARSAEILISKHSRTTRHILFSLLLLWRLSLLLSNRLKSEIKSKQTLFIQWKDISTKKVVARRQSLCALRRTQELEEKLLSVTQERDQLQAARDKFQQLHQKSIEARNRAATKFYKYQLYTAARYSDTTSKLLTGLLIVWRQSVLYGSQLAETRSLARVLELSASDAPLPESFVSMVDAYAERTSTEGSPFQTIRPDIFARLPVSEATAVYVILCRQYEQARLEYERFVESCAAPTECPNDAVLKAKLEESKTSFGRLEKTHCDNLKSLEKVRMSLQEKKEEIAKLTSDNRDLRTRMKDIQGTKISSETKLAVVRQQLAESEKRLKQEVVASTRNGEVVTWKMQCGIYVEKLKSFETLQEEYEKIQVCLVKTEENVTQLRANIASLQMRNMKLDQDYKTVCASLRAKQQVVEDQEKRIRKTESQVCELQGTKGDLQTKLSLALEQLDTLKKKTDDNDRELKERLAEVKALQDRCQLLDKQVQEKDRGIETLRHESGLWKCKFDDLEFRQQKLDASLSDYSQKYTASLNDLQTCKSRLAAAEKTCADSIRQCFTVRKECDAERLKVTKLTTDSQQSNDKIKKLRDDVKTFESHIRVKDQELQQSRIQLQDLDEQYRESVAEANRLQVDLREVRTSLDHSEQHIRAAEEQVVHVRSQVRSSMQEIRTLERVRKDMTVALAVVFKGLPPRPVSPSSTLDSISDFERTRIGGAFYDYSIEEKEERQILASRVNKFHDKIRWLEAMNAGYRNLLFAPPLYLQQAMASSNSLGSTPVSQVKRPTSGGVPLGIPSRSRQGAMVP